MFLLDTNVCIRILNGSSDAVVNRLRSVPPSSVRLCSVVLAELMFGARNSAHVEQNLRTIERFRAPFISLPFDDAAAEHYGAIRAELTRSGALIGPNDLLIAAIARANDLALITHNQSEFGRVTGLRVEDWER
jgi:tRNA(fMet)-specific endonuclease VapC